MREVNKSQQLQLAYGRFFEITGISYPSTKYILETKGFLSSVRVFFFRPNVKPSFAAEDFSVTFFDALDQEAFVICFPAAFRRWVEL